jgi:hypothetical protein
MLISVRGWVDPRAIVWPDGLSQWKIPMTPSWIATATFRGSAPASIWVRLLKFSSTMETQGLTTCLISEIHVCGSSHSLVGCCTYWMCMYYRFDFQAWTLKNILPKSASYLWPGNKFLYFRRGSSHLLHTFELEFNSNSRIQLYKI